MEEKMKVYLDELFAPLPSSEAVDSTKEELYAGMVERYEDNLKAGMDEQEAYDAVLDVMGDLQELRDELAREESEAKEQPSEGSAEEPRPKYENYSAVHEFVDNVANFTTGLLSGLFSGDYSEDMKLVNTRTQKLVGIQNIDVSFVTESLTLAHAPGDELIVREYMNKDEVALYATVEVEGNGVNVRNGRRQGVFGLRSRVEILLPAGYEGALSLGTVGGSIRSEDEWHVASFTARTVSGEVQMESVEAGVIRLSSTSGSVQLGHGVGTMDLHSVSGSIRVQQASGGGMFRTTSGTVRAHFNELSGPVEASSISGGVRLGLPSDTSFEFDASSVSGNIHTGFDALLSFQRRNKAHGLVGQPPYFHVRASSKSGGIHVND